MPSRREFLEAGSLVAALSSAAFAARLRAVGVQLYTVRTLFPDKAPETLKAIAEIGYKETEATFANLDRVVPAIEAAKLKPVSVHLDSAMVTKGNPDDLARAMDDLKKKGFAYAVYPYLPPNERGGLDAIRSLAAKLNMAAGKAHAAGLKFCYHNHAFEFQPTEGTTPFQVLLDSTDAKTVGIEMDAFWVSVAGNDPAEMLGKLKGRVPLLHVKDKAQGTAVQYNEGVPRTAFKEAGNGTLDWPKIFRAAQSAGVEHYFVEQDQTPGDPVESLRQSYTFLSKLNF